MVRKHSIEKQMARKKNLNVMFFHSGKMPSKKNYHWLIGVSLFFVCVEEHSRKCVCVVHVLVDHPFGSNKTEHFVYVLLNFRGEFTTTTKKQPLLATSTHLFQYIYGQLLLLLLTTYVVNSNSCCCCYLFFLLFILVGIAMV